MGTLRLMPRTWPCAQCGAKMYHGTGSLGPGKSVCRVCRRKARPQVVKTPTPLETRECRTCGQTFEQRQPTQIYCTPECRPRQPWRPKQRNKKYGAKHAAQRKLWASRLECEGQMPCSLCGEPVVHGSAWHLDHVPGSDTEYRGVSHPGCNVSDGARRGALIGNRSSKRQPQTSVTLDSGRTVDLRQCVDCGKTCFGLRCQGCHRAQKARTPRPIL